MELNGTVIEQYMIDIFWQRIKFPDNLIDKCWEVSGSKDKDGYPNISVKNRTRKAHRFSFVIHNPEIDISNKIIRHTCDNPGCVNPNQLLIGTPEDNIMDMMERNRQLKGSSNGYSILTEDIIEEILYNIISNKIHSINDIMSIYKLSRPHIHQILNGDIWTQVTTPYLQKYKLTLLQVKHMIVKNKMMI